MVETNTTEDNNLIDPLEIAEQIKDEGDTTEGNPDSESSQGEGSGTGIDANTAALICYLFLLIGGVIFYLLEKRDSFIRFAAMQSIIFGATVIGFLFVLRSLAFIAPSIFGIITILFSIGSFYVWLMLMYRAFNNQEWELPVIGKIARDVITKK